MNRTKIPYVDYSWNLWTGCYHNCPYCYGRRIAERFRRKDGEKHVESAPFAQPGAPVYRARADSPPFPMGFDLTYYAKREAEPLQLRKDGHRIFAGDMTDVFGAWVPISWQLTLFAIMAAAREQTFIVLTKAPDVAHDRLTSAMFINGVEYEAGRFTHGYDGEWPLPNVWLGVTAEDQRRADERIPILLQVPAAVRFVSHEPALGAITYPPEFLALGQRAWVVTGGESGPGARPMHPDWARHDRDQCAAAGVPWFFKAWGEWVSRTQLWEPVVSEGDGGIRRWRTLDGKPLPFAQFGALTRSGVWFPETTTWNGRQEDPQDDYEVSMMRVGKKRAGHLLDGREHREWPR